MVSVPKPSSGLSLTALQEVFPFFAVHAVLLYSVQKCYSFLLASEQKHLSKFWITSLILLLDPKVAIKWW